MASMPVVIPEDCGITPSSFEILPNPVGKNKIVNWLGTGSIITQGIFESVFIISPT